LFGLHLVYKLRNASMEVNKEKLILGLAVLIELITSALVYLIRHSLWRSLTSDHLLVLYAIRCQLTVTLTVALVFGPKVSSAPRPDGDETCRRAAGLMLLSRCNQAERPASGR
jgi:hypothetical protein